MDKAEQLRNQFEHIVYMELLGLYQDNGLSISAANREAVKNRIVDGILSKLTEQGGEMESAEEKLKRTLEPKPFTNEPKDEPIKPKSGGIRLPRKHNGLIGSQPPAQDAEALQVAKDAVNEVVRYAHDGQLYVTQNDAIKAAAKAVAQKVREAVREERSVTLSAFQAILNKKHLSKEGLLDAIEKQINHLI